MSRKPLRPPGAQGERKFLGSCIRCGKCAQVCPYRSIIVVSLLDGLSMMGTPYIRAREIPCYLCMKCPPVCPSGALDRELARMQNVRMGTAIIDKKTCLPWQGILCRSCYENCPIFNEAIIMDDQLRPVVDQEKCVGCGICENVCPVDPAAIIVKAKADK